MEFVLSAVVSYLLGSISFSYLISKKVAGIDIRSHGSGNAGATNTLRVLGTGPAILVLLLDAIKGMAAVAIAWWISDYNTVIGALAGIFAIIGHNWPIFFQFRGGKGIATTIGVALLISPLAFIISVLLCVAVIAITRYVSVGSLVFVTAFPISLYFISHNVSLCLVVLIITVFGFVRHYSNIRNLLAGKERKIGEKTPKDSQ